MNLSDSPENFHLLSVAVPRPIEGLFTYKLPERFLPQVQVGGWVKVPFGRIQTHAFVVEPPRPMTEVPEGLSLESLKEVLEVNDQGSIVSEDVLSLCRWASEYYQAPLGEVLHCAAPPASLGLKNAKKEARPIDQRFEQVQAHELTEAQKLALNQLEQLRQSKTPRVALLHGVTGSGKTELYLDLARKTLAEGRSVLLLVPEIALTSQLHHRFEQGLGVAVGLWHSAMSDGKRRDLGAAVRKGEIRVVVGARSAVFAPLARLGLIVIDEEHDPTYKQEDRVRYHARDLAVVRAKLSDAFVVLGSATPSLETRQRVAEGKYAVARLDQRIAPGGLPSIELVNLCSEPLIQEIQSPLALRSVEAIRETVDAGEQAMVFLNRRGFASFLVCQDCGEVKGCPNCSISLTVHFKGTKLRCHVCGHQEITADTCQKCSGHELRAIGSGTESLSDELNALIPQAKLLRLDRDQVTSAGRLESILGDFREGKANVLLGTQMLVKGHDFPNVTLVLVILADALFRWPDFRASERAFQILKQVSGRAGRGDRPGRVLIQSYQVDHPVIQTLDGRISEDSFLETERQLREALGYPPFGRMARMRLESRNKDEAVQRAHAVFDWLRPFMDEGKLEILGPSEAFLERAKGIFRWDLLLKAKEIRALQRAVMRAKEGCSRQKWQFLVDVDPYGVG